jgi:hypothetical protein
MFFGFIILMYRLYIHLVHSSSQCRGTLRSLAWVLHNFRRWIILDNSLLLSIIHRCQGKWIFAVLHSASSPVTYQPQRTRLLSDAMSLEDYFSADQHYECWLQINCKKTHVWSYIFVSACSHVISRIMYRTLPVIIGKISPDTGLFSITLFSITWSVYYPLHNILTRFKSYTFMVIALNDL